jgi:hypothetical protein
MQTQLSLALEQSKTPDRALVIELSYKLDLCQKLTFNASTTLPESHIQHR